MNQFTQIASLCLNSGGGAAVGIRTYSTPVASPMNLLEYSLGPRVSCPQEVPATSDVTLVPSHAHHEVEVAHPCLVSIRLLAHGLLYTFRKNDHL